MRQLGRNLETIRRKQKSGKMKSETTAKSKQCLYQPRINGSRVDIDSPQTVASKNMKRLHLPHQFPE